MRSRVARPTIRDVARLAGVSVSSVSRVLNNVEPLSAQLKSQVAAAVQATGFKPKKNPIDTRGPLVVLLPGTHNAYFLEIIKGIEDQGLRYGYMINLISLMENPEYKERLMRWLAKSRCSGVIVISSSGGISDSNLIRLMDVHGIPIVLLNRKIDHAGIPSIGIDFSEGMYRITRHLLELGHRRIGFLARPLNSESGRGKRAGIERAFREAGRAIDPRLWLPGLPSIEWGFHGTRTLIDFPPARRPTAILAFNDLTALGCLHALRQSQLHVPAQISVAGFDDIAMAAHSNPPLTTVAPPKYEIGVLAVQMIDQMRKGLLAQVRHFTLLDTPLVVRESSGKCPSRKIS